MLGCPLPGPPPTPSHPAGPPPATLQPSPIRGPAPHQSWPDVPSFLARSCLLKSHRPVPLSTPAAPSLAAVPNTPSLLFIASDTSRAFSRWRPLTSPLDTTGLGLGVGSSICICTRVSPHARPEGCRHDDVRGRGVQPLHPEDHLERFSCPSGCCPFPTPAPAAASGLDSWRAEGSPSRLETPWGRPWKVSEVNTWG